MIKTPSIKLKTKGNTDIIDITKEVQNLVGKSGIKDGLVCIFVTGSTAGLTTMEYEPGLVKDLQEMFERLVPSDKEYHHNEKWHDDNGHSHVRASLLGPSLNIPIVNGELTLGTWEQIVFIDFDIRPRNRELVVQITGEGE